MATRIFTEEEIEDLLAGCEIFSEDIYQGRWAMNTRSIIEYEGVLYEVLWERGLTEYQENYFPNLECTIVNEYHDIACYKEVYYAAEPRKDETDYNKEIQSLSIVSKNPEDILDSARSLDLDKIEDFRKLLHSVSGVDSIGNVEALRTASLKLLDELEKINAAAHTV